MSDALRLKASPVLTTVTPTVGGGESGIATANSITEPGPSTCHFAIRNAEAISRAKLAPSMSPARNHTLPLIPGKPLSDDPTSICCFLVSLRQATFSSISMRASLSCSAICLKRAASSSFLEARSSAFEARSLASAASLRALATCCSEMSSSLNARSDAFEPKWYSPYTPPAIAIPARIVSTSSFRESSFLFSQRRMVYSTRRPTNTAIVHTAAQWSFRASAVLSASISRVPTGYYRFIREEYRRRWIAGVLALLSVAPILSPGISAPPRFPDNSIPPKIGPSPNLAETICGERMSRARSRSTRYLAFCPLMVWVLCAPFVVCTRKPSAPGNHTSAST
jgi:hypothetical protein